MPTSKKTTKESKLPVTQKVRPKAGNLVAQTDPDEIIIKKLGVVLQNLNAYHEKLIANRRGSKTIDLDTRNQIDQVISILEAACIQLNSLNN